MFARAAAVAAFPEIYFLRAEFQVRARASHFSRDNIFFSYVKESGVSERREMFGEEEKKPLFERGSV